MWQPISSAPYGSDLERSVIEQDVTHALAFPCRRGLYGWIDAATQRRVDVRPTHWRPWGEVELLAALAEQGRGGGN